MSTPPQGEPLWRAGSVPPIRRGAAADLTDLLPDLLVDGLQEEWQARLQGLQERICELLIKNQQLRMALMEMKARGPEDDNGRNPGSSRNNPAESLRLS